FLFSLAPPPPRSPLFPYTTLFRSVDGHLGPVKDALRLVKEALPVHPQPPAPGRVAGHEQVLRCGGFPYHLGLLGHDGHPRPAGQGGGGHRDRKSTRLNSSHVKISYAVFCLKKKKTQLRPHTLSHALV